MTDWKACIKKPVIVHYREIRPGETVVSTREGITPVLETDLLMMGVDGEVYPIARDIFEKTYRTDVENVLGGADAGVANE